MLCSTISIFGNKIFLEIINELKLFRKSKINFVKDISLLLNGKFDNNYIIIFFINGQNVKELLKIKKLKKPIIVLVPKEISHNKYSNDFVEQINMPFKIENFEKKLVAFVAKNKFRNTSLIYLKDYVIDKYGRKIKKNSIELQMTEKETELLILFSEQKKPLSRNFVLQNVWKYSSESDTHTVETHIHRLRKKILIKFGDKNFIKNNSEGYYI